VGKIGLGRPFQGALALWGLPLVLVAAWPTPAVAFAMLALSGFGNSILDVSGFTAMQEGADGRVLGRIFGLFELVVIVTVGIGWLLAPALVAATGTRAGLLTVGCVLPALAILFHRGLGRIDEGTVDRAADVEIVRRTPIFAALPYVTARALAAGLETIDAPAGATVIEEGEAGDRFYIIETGRVSVTVDGRGVGELGPGDGFGEIALLMDVPRVATVTSLEPLRLRAVRRDAFLAAVTSHAVTKDEADRIARERLPAEAPSLAPV
jgi:hypothetical protein